MPPTMLKTIRDLVYWEFAKLVAEIAVGDRKNYRYVMSTYLRFKRTEPDPLTIMRENGLESKGYGECAYCGASEDLVTEYIVQSGSIGGARPDNQITVCKKCRKSKGKKDLYRWYGKDRRYEIPRLVLAKYLKIVYEIHEQNRMLDAKRTDKLDVYDLGSFTKKRAP